MLSISVYVITQFPIWSTIQSKKNGMTEKLGKFSSGIFLGIISNISIYYRSRGDGEAKRE